jgi:hypothetical protein
MEKEVYFSTHVIFDSQCFENEKVVLHLGQLTNSFGCKSIGEYSHS